jgi:hypothetical protein
MVDIDFNALLSSYQKKVTELINQNIVYEAKLTAQANLIVELQNKISILESLKPKKKAEPTQEDF